MIAPDDLIGLKELADKYEREAVHLVQGAAEDWLFRTRAQALQLFQLAAMLREYAKGNG